MNATPVFVALVLLCRTAGAGEVDEPAGLTEPPAEPRIQHTVIEDDGARIEELRVRGQIQRMRVQPKGAIQQGYEVIPADAAHDTSEGAGSSRGAAGKRVWRVLNF